MESFLKDHRGGESVLDLSPRSTVGGGVEDVYGEDRASEDHLVTPWTVSVARYLIRASATFFYHRFRLLVFFCFDSDQFHVNGG